MKVDKIITPIIKDSAKSVRKNFLMNCSANIAGATVVTVRRVQFLHQYFNSDFSVFRKLSVQRKLLKKYKG